MTVTREEALEIFARRRATRAYDPDRRIGDEDFAAILEFARLSPSSVGTEPWKFLVIRTPNCAKSSSRSPGAWRAPSTTQATWLFCWRRRACATTPRGCAAPSKAATSPREQMEAALERYGNFQKNDMKVLESDRALFDWASKQTYIALGNMMTGAAMLGIDSCPIEGMNYDAVNELLVSAGLFDPEEYGVSVAVTFGYRAREIAPKSRRSIEDLVTWA